MSGCWQMQEVAMGTWSVSNVKFLDIKLNPAFWGARWGDQTKWTSLNSPSWSVIARSDYCTRSIDSCITGPFFPTLHVIACSDGSNCFKNWIIWNTVPFKKDDSWECQRWGCPLPVPHRNLQYHFEVFLLIRFCPSMEYLKMIRTGQWRCKWKCPTRKVSLHTARVLCYILLNCDARVGMSQNLE